LRQDLTILNRKFEATLDRKTAMIQSLVQDVDEAEIQYQTASQHHAANVDRLIDAQRKRVEELRRDFQAQLDVIQREFAAEADTIKSRGKAYRESLLEVAHAMESEISEKEADMRQEFQGARDELKNKNLEEKHALRIQLEGQVEQLWKTFQNELNRYNAATADRKKQFEALRDKDAKAAQLIEQQMRKLQRIQDNISNVRNRMQTLTADCEERNASLRRERDAVSHHYQELKSRLVDSREVAKQRLVRLTVRCTEASKVIRARLERAERVVKLSEVCRKLETEEEKILPFYPSAVQDAELAQYASDETAKVAAESAAAAQRDVMGSAPGPSGSALMRTQLVNQDGTPVSDFHVLDGFWKRYNKVLLDKLALERERDGHRQENEQLKAMLKQYLDSISVNEQVLAAANPLLVVNGNTNAPLVVPVGDPRVRRTGVPDVRLEAAHIVRTTQRSIAL
jgi:dynein regulatory complex subunit 2